MEMQRYLISSWNVAKQQFDDKCFVDAPNQAHAIAKAYRLGGIHRDQVDTAKAEITDRKF
jgi:hypothetical protein